MINCSMLSLIAVQMFLPWDLLHSGCVVLGYIKNILRKKDLQCVQYLTYIAMEYWLEWLYLRVKL